MTGTELPPNKLFTRLKAIGIAAMIDRGVFHPFENVVSLRQKHTALSNVGAFREMRERGFLRSCYSGISLPFVLSIPSRLSVFTSNLYCRDFLCENSQLSFLSVVTLSAVVASMCEIIVSCPSETYRTYRSLDAMPERFWPNAYRGGGVFLSRLMVGNVTTLAGSEMLLKTAYGTETPPHFAPFVSGATAGMIAQIATTPIDMLKTRVMISPSPMSVWDHMRAIVEAGSAFNGLWIRMLRSGLGWGSTLSIIAYFETMLADGRHQASATEWCEQEEPLRVLGPKQ